MKNPQIILSTNWENSLSKQGFPENHISLYMKNDRVYFSFNILFDADEDEWDRGSAVFTKDEFEKCLVELNQNGKAEITGTQEYTANSTLILTRKEKGTHVWASCNEQGCNHTFSQTPEEILQRFKAC